MVPGVISRADLEEEILNWFLELSDEEFELAGQLLKDYAGSAASTDSEAGAFAGYE